MSSSPNVMKYLVIGFFALGIGIPIYNSFVPPGNSNTTSSTNVVKVAVKVPELSEFAKEGKAAFDNNCASCHGSNGSGTENGPPLIHDIYNPGHHADESFLRAVKSGVGQHHWPYGNMPPQPQVSRKEIETIVKYIREVQVANGIVYREHRM